MKARIPACAALLLILCLAGCTGTTTVKWKTLDDPFGTIDEGRSWKGHTREEVIEVWGKPTSVTKDAEGGEIWVYKVDRKVAVSVSATDGTIRDDGVARPTTMPEEPESSRILDPTDPSIRTKKSEKKEIGRFWIDEDGKVYRYTMDHKLFEEGEHDPPKPVPDL